MYCPLPAPGNMATLLTHPFLGNYFRQGGNSISSAYSAEFLETMMHKGESHMGEACRV